MNKYLNVFLCVLCLLSCVVWANVSNKDVPVSDNAEEQKHAPFNPAQGTYAYYIFNRIKEQNPDATRELTEKAFSYAYVGLLNLKAQGVIDKNSSLISICDFTLSGNVKRLWVIDVKSKKVLIHSLVSHGRNTGEEFATSFSNKDGSYQSSLGFYITDTTYQGSNGYSLRLYGLDANLNDNAERRAIVMHGAAYCSEDFIQEHGRLGRSLGCPSVPLEQHREIINTIKDRTLLYIYHEGQPVLNTSKWLKSTQKSLLAGLENALMD